MPTYQYACTACGHQLEAVQSFADEPLTECPSCEGRLRKLFSSVGVVFKGSGFYRTDSRAAAKEGGPSRDGGPTKDGASTKDGAPAKEATAAKDTSATKDSGGKDSGTAKKADSSAKPAAAAA